MSEPESVMFVKRPVGSIALQAAQAPVALDNFLPQGSFLLRCRAVIKCPSHHGIRGLHSGGQPIRQAV